MNTNGSILKCQCKQGFFHNRPYCIGKGYTVWGRLFCEFLKFVDKNEISYNAQLITEMAITFFIVTYSNK